MDSDPLRWIHYVDLAALIMVASIALMSWLLRQRSFGGDRRGDAVVMRYPWGWHLFGWTYLIVSVGGLAFLVWRFPPKPDEIWIVVGLIAFFGSLGGYVVVEVTGVAHQVHPSGLMRCGPFRGRAFLPWSEVVSIRFVELASAWRIRVQNGDSAWVPFQLSGIGTFAAAALEHLAPEVIDRVPGTRAKLERLARGIPGPNVASP
jgi:hypothetical protein